MQYAYSSIVGYFETGEINISLICTNFLIKKTQTSLKYKYSKSLIKI